MMGIPDYKQKDYKSFVFVSYEDFGLLLLYCTRKPLKGPYFQLPGGHVDDIDFEKVEKKESNSMVSKIILSACQTAAGRELYEETGIDIRNNLERLKPAKLYPPGTHDELNFVLEDKCYFYLSVHDGDFFNRSRTTAQSNIVTSMDGSGPPNLELNLSEEHSGFLFESNPRNIIYKIRKHSGGTGSKAFQMSLRHSDLNEWSFQQNVTIFHVVIYTLLAWFCIIVYHTMKKIKKEEKKNFDDLLDFSSLLN